ncbi:hypothetical protein AAVH_24135 [Aphelenchoides avenae]|nr:hypothetical protein AAVH_24135 [Aphelenchus avenae]
MSSNQGMSKGVALMQTALDAVRSEHTESVRHLGEVQRKLTHSQARIMELEKEKSTLSPENTHLRQRNEHIEKLVAVLKTQLEQQHKARKAELERANDATQENKTLRARLSKAEELAALVPSLKVVEKDCWGFIAETSKRCDALLCACKQASEQHNADVDETIVVQNDDCWALIAYMSKRCDSLQSARRQAARENNADANKSMNSLNEVKQEVGENVTEGRAYNTPVASSAMAGDMPDGVNAAAGPATASTSEGLATRPRGRPRKAAVVDPSGPAAANTGVPLKRQRTTATASKRARAATKRGLTAANMTCSHESCQRPTSEVDPPWVSCSRCTRWFHCVCLDETPNHDDWVCGTCP